MINGSSASLRTSPIAVILSLELSVPSSFVIMDLMILDFSDLSSSGAVI